LFGCKIPSPNDQRPSEYYPAFFESLLSLRDKTVAITGGSRGLGYTTALTVAKKGGTVILLNRPSETATKALKALQEVTEKDVSHHLVECDLLSFESARRACEQVQQLTQDTGIDILCNNAGIMLQPDQASKDGYDITASTNVLSHFLITKELLPSLEKAATQKGTPARIINMSSINGYGGNPLDPSFFEQRGGNLGGAQTSNERYHQTKLANLIFTCALHDKFQSTKKPILALACTPGVCATDMFVHASTVMYGQPSPKSMVPSVEDGAMAQLKCIFDATVESGQLWGPGQNGALDCTPMIPPRILVDERSKKELWEVCEKAVGEFIVE
jgi:NAD(P)-dependent dehydrogenase (short-subunit alcohol dehydrogenase family)